MATVPPSPRYVVGVDFGGTKIVAAVVDHQLQCVNYAKVSTKASRGQAAVIERITRCVQQAIDESDLQLADIQAVGIGAPGAVNPAEGVVLYGPNLNWQNVPLKKELEQSLGVPVYLDNDANLATLGVYHRELLAKPAHIAGIFIGTGIGGGVVLNHRLHRGFNSTAGELGHMVLDLNGPQCGCGHRGCFEALASRLAIFKRVREGVRAGRTTLLTGMLGEKLEDLRSGDLRKAFRRGDSFVAEVIEEAARYTGVAISNLIHVLNPEVVVLGGGVIEAVGEYMLPTITDTAFGRALPGTAKGIEILLSSLADDAGIIGAAALAWQPESA